MRDVRRLLLAIDLHRESRLLTAGSCLAADQAAELAKRVGCDVVLLYATGADAAGNAQVQSIAAGAARVSARHVLEQEADRFRSLGVSAQVEIADGEPAWLAIVRHALNDRIDLVIAGRRNERTHRVGHLGSVSKELLRNCPCPVWVAKLGGPVAPRCVLAASDLAPVGERVLEYAAFVARHFGAALHVVHAFEILPDGVRLHAECDARTRQLAEQLARIAGAPAAEFHVVSEDATDAVLGSSSRLAADLVVMGTLSRGGIPGLLIGNTAERLLGRLDASLLTVKPDGFVCPVARDD
jgi:Universal stress protein UspA and related nucleotide-binding proteins